MAWVITAGALVGVVAARTTCGHLLATAASLAPTQTQSRTAASAVPHESTARFFPHAHSSELVLQDVWDDSDLDETYQILYVTRHGETTMNALGRMQGRGVNASLNDKGVQQAEMLGHFLARTPLFIACSSLDRAHQTAMAIAAQNQRNDAPFKTQLKPVLQLEGLDELSWGWMEGEPKDLEPVKTPLKQLLGAWASGNYTAAAEGGESAQAVFDRSQSALSQVLKHGHRHNLVVTHGRTMRILLLGLAGLPISDMDAFGSVPNTGVYVFAVKDGQYEMLFPQVNSCQSEEDQEEERAICQNAPQSE